MVISRIKRRKGEELERPVLQPVSLLMQPFGIVAGTFIDDVIDEGGDKVTVVYWERDGTLPVG